MGLLTFILASSSAIPQIITIRKTRNTSGVSLISLVVCNIDNVFWLIWTFGFYFNSMLMYQYEMNRTYQVSLLILCFAYIFGSILVCYLMIVKIQHLRKCKQLHISELELANILLNKDKQKYFVDNKWNNGKRFLLPICFVILNALLAFTVVAILWKFAYWQPVKGTKEWVWVVVMSFIASVIWEASCWPQLVKSFREKDTTGMSMFWCAFSFVNCVINFVYDLSLSYGTGGFSYNLIFILIFSAIAPNLGVLIIKIMNVTKAKKMGLSEVEYTKQVLIPAVIEKRKQKQLEKEAKVKN